MPPCAPIVRKATIEDYPALVQLWQRNGLSIGMEQEHWRDLWAANPFRGLFQDVPIGWVLESAAGQLVGTLSNLHSLCFWRNRPVRTAVASSWAVDPEYRAYSLLLLKHFSQQPGIDLLLNTSANEKAGKIMKICRLDAVPHPAYEQQLIWVVNPMRFTEAALRQNNAPAPALTRYPVAGALACWTALRRREHLRDIVLARLPEFDDLFDPFWTKLVQQSRRLLTVRNRAALKWRFGRHLERGSVMLIAAKSAGQLNGYAILLRQQSRTSGLREFQVIDLQAQRDDPSCLRSILMETLTLAREEQVDMVRMIGFHPWKRRAIQRGTGCLSHATAVGQYYYRAVQPALQEDLAEAGAWDPSPFDGDITVAVHETNDSN